MAVLPTVKIVSDDSKQGFMIINKSDLTEEHKIFVEKKKINKKKEVKND